MFNKILDLLSNIVDAFRERRRGEQAKTIEQQRHEIDELNGNIKYQRAQGAARLNAQRAATEAGKQRNEEYRSSR